MAKNGERNEERERRMRERMAIPSISGDRRSNPQPVTQPLLTSSLLEVAIGMAFPTSETVIHQSPIKEGCVKVSVDEIVEEYENLPVHSVTKTAEVRKVKDMFHGVMQWPRFAIKLVGKETPSKSTSAMRMGSSGGSPSCTGASLEFHTNDTASTQLVDKETPSKSTSAMRMGSSGGSPSRTGASLEFHTNDTASTQVEAVNRFLEFQTQDVMMQPVQGSLMNMILNFSNLQPGFQNQFELPTLNSEPNPIPESNPDPEPEPQQSPESEGEDATVVGGEFEDPDLPQALNSIKSRPQPVQDLVRELTDLVGRSYVVKADSPNDMYPESIVEAVLYSELLQIFLNGWLDVSLLHWFAMHFFEKPNSQCAFLNPTKINGPMCDEDPVAVGNHIREIVLFHSKKSFVLAPYIQSEHWSLIILHPTQQRGYIVDSMRKKKEPEDYMLVSIIDDVFGKQRIKWEMVKCKQQEGDWECGYMVIKHMEEFVDHIQYDIFKQLWKEDGEYPQSKIEELVLRLMPELISKAFNGPE